MLKREHFTRPEYSVFENIWVVDNTGKIFQAEWMALSHSFGVIICPELGTNFNISKGEFGDLNTKENAIMTARDHLHKLIATQQAFINSQKIYFKRVRAMLEFQWNTMTDFAKRVLYKLGAMPSREFERILQNKDEYISYLKKFYEAKARKDIGERQDRLTVQLHKLFSIQDKGQSSYIFNLDQKLYNDEEDTTRTTNMITAHIHFLDYPLVFWFREDQQRFLQLSNPMEFRKELADLIVEELFDRHVDTIRANIKEQAIEFLTKIEDKIHGVSNR